VALLEVCAADLGAVLLDETVVPTACGEDVLDFLVVEAGEEEAAGEEGFVNAGKW